MYHCFLSQKECQTLPDNKMHFALCALSVKVSGWPETRNSELPKSDKLSRKKSRNFSVYLLKSLWHSHTYGTEYISIRRPCEGHIKRLSLISAGISGWKWNCKFRSPNGQQIKNRLRRSTWGRIRWRRCDWMWFDTRCNTQCDSMWHSVATCDWQVHFTMNSLSEGNVFVQETAL